MEILKNLSLPSVTKSKRFWVAVIGLAAMMITPENASVEILERIASVQDAILMIVLTLVTGYSAQDVASAFKGENKYNEAQG